jgi:hypothetical protein
LPAMTMRRMKRLIIIAAASFAAASLTLPALASNGRAVRGTVAAKSSDAISVKGKSGIVTTCALGSRSPSVSSVAVGDTVLAVCVRRGHGPLTLAKLRKLTAAVTAAPDTEPVKFGGAITALSDTSISLHDGDRDLTCAIDSTSPSTADYKIGQHVKAVCAGGVLVAIAPITPGDVGRWFTGTVASLTDSAITLTTEHGPVTCTITALSPSTALLKVGDRIGMGCRASTMELVLIKPLSGDDPPPAPAPPTGGGDDGGSGGDDGGGGQTQTDLKARGAITVIGEHSISLQTDGGTVTCTRDDHSPSLDGYAVGNRVAVECVNGALTEIERLETTA